MKKNGVSEKEFLEHQVLLVLEAIISLMEDGKFIRSYSQCNLLKTFIEKRIFSLTFKDSVTDNVLLDSGEEEDDLFSYEHSEEDDEGIPECFKK